MSLPVVALVGRPNVGKSTLFNRIVKSRASIVDDMPGVTRDRKYLEAEWAGRHFLLVDTGGYLPNTDDRIENAVFEQLVGAIEEADLVVFLVDARAGLTALDQEIALELKRNDVATLLTVNKVDSDKIELDSNEFYQLGLGDYVTVSAISGRKVGDFLDQVISRFPESQLSEKATATPHVSLAVIGRPNVGKSSFVNAILGEERQIVTDVPGTTRDSNDTIFKYFGQEFRVIDTAGLRRKSRVRENVEFYSTVRAMASIRQCDVAILILDATAGLESQDMRILQEAIRLNKGVLIAVNKWDLVEKDNNTAKEFEEKIRDALKNVTYVPVMFISALAKQRIFKVIDVAKSVQVERGRTIKTSELNSLLEKLIKKYPPPSMDRKEVKIKYCTQIRSCPPVFAFFTNAPKSIPANYRAYLENNFRKQYGFLGVPLSLVFRQK